MKRKVNTSRRACGLLRALAAGLALAGCGGSSDAEYGHNPEHGHGHEVGHAHHAPHGGTLAMLGDHAFQLELIADPQQGRLQLYVLDGEAERFVRIAATELAAEASSGERSWQLRFLPVADEATGEKVGDSAYFVAQAPELARLEAFRIHFEPLEIRGRRFEDVAFLYPEGQR